MKQEREFPGSGKVVRIPGFHCHGQVQSLVGVTEIPPATQHRWGGGGGRAKQDVVTLGEEPQEEPTAAVTAVGCKK